jgi:AcrR family transcriptional regulator
VSALNPGPLASRRRESSRLAILDAALALCREEGYAKLSIEAIATRAGVGKQTIYRWWRSKGAVLLEALDREAAVAAAFPDTGDLVADMRATITDVVRFQSNPSLGPPLAALIAEAQQDPGIGPMLLERFFEPRRAPIAERLRRAQEAGHLPATLDVEAVLEVIFGALFHRLLLRSGPLDAEYAAFVVDVVLAGAAAVRPAAR